MNKNVFIVVGVVVILLIAGGVYVYSQNNKEAVSRQSQAPVKPENSEAMMKKDEENKVTEDKNTIMEKDAMVKNGSYQDYSPEKVTSEQSSGNKVVLFFHASWCPFCKAANTAFLGNTADIPSGVTVLKTDYDSNGDLKQKYGVTTQHTYVQIDGDGKIVTKWVGGDIDALKKNLK